MPPSVSHRAMLPPTRSDMMNGVQMERGWGEIRALGCWSHQYLSLPFPLWPACLSAEAGAWGKATGFCSKKRTLRYGGG